PGSLTMPCSFPLTLARRAGRRGLASVSCGPLRLSAVGDEHVRGVPDGTLDDLLARAGGVDDLPVAHIDAHVAVVVAGEGDEVAGPGLGLGDDPTAEHVSLGGLARQVHTRLVVGEVHQPRAVEAGPGRLAAPGVPGAELRAGGVDDRLSARGVADRSAVVVPTPGTRGDAHIAVQGVTGLGAEYPVRADPAVELQTAQRSCDSAAYICVDGFRGAARVQLRLERLHGSAALALAELRMPHGGRRCGRRGGAARAEGEALAQRRPG